MKAMTQVVAVAISEPLAMTPNYGRRHLVKKLVLTVTATAFLFTAGAYLSAPPAEAKKKCRPWELCQLDPIKGFGRESPEGCGV